MPTKRRRTAKSQKSDIVHEEELVINSREESNRSAVIEKETKLYHQSLLVHCIRCGQKYDKLDGVDELCEYHTGILMFDRSAWFDYDEPNEFLDTLDQRVQYPEAFT